MTYAVLRRLMRIVARVVLFPSPHVRGRETVPRHGPLLVVGNHIATVDPPLVGALLPRRDVYYMAKSESFSPRAGWLFRAYNAFPVVRHSADRAALRRGLEVLAAGHVLVVYPEGSRSPDTRMHRAYPGAGFLARRSGAPVLPAAIWGSERALPKGANVPRHARVTIAYGRPFTVPARHPDGTPVTNQQAVDLMMGRVAELLPERYRGVYADVAGLDRMPPAA